MGQTRYNSYGRPLVSFDEDRRTIGLAIPGVYCGWDRITLTGGTSINIVHDITGVKATKADNGSQDGPFGLVVSNHGVEVYEDGNIPLNIAFNAANAHVRVDWIVMSHSYLASTGGSAAIYSVIQGPDGVDYGEPAGLANVNTQVLIAKVYVPSGAADLTGIAYVKQQVPKLGGYGFNKLSETDIQDGNNGEAVIDNLNLIIKTGVYHFNTTVLNPPVATRHWNIIVLKRGVYVTQLASDAGNGKLYSRNSSNTGTSWSAWVNLNNADITDYSAQIGTRLYTQENYIADGQTVTQSLDAIDIAVKGIVGDRNYPNELLVDNESMTASFIKLDNAYALSFRYTGTQTGSGNPNYPAGQQGQIRVVNVAGKIGGSSGKVIGIGDLVICIADNAGGTEAAVGTSWVVAVNGGVPGLLSKAAGAVDTSNIATGAVDHTKVDQSVFATDPAQNDFNNLIPGKLDALSGSQANAPTAGGTKIFMTITTPDGITNGNRQQLAIQVAGAGTGAIYQRGYTGLTTTWSAWTNINN